MKPIHPLLATIAWAVLAGALPLAAADGKPVRPSYGSAPLDPFAQSILDLHNRERTRLGSAPLRWDPALAAAAGTYARQLASGPSLAHASRAGRTGQRENLSMGMRGWTPQQMMNNWIEEKRNFLPGIFPDISRTGQWSNASHYSQMVRSTTTSVGCGLAAGAQWQYLVCRYAPAGNIDGRPVLSKPCDPPPSAAPGASMRLANAITRSPCLRG